MGKQRKEIDVDLTHELVENWKAALRSGDFKQIQYTIMGGEGNSFCCLGVLAKVAGLSDKEIRSDGYGIINSHYIEGALMDCNDKLGYTFPEIADKVQEMQDKGDLP